MATYYVSTTGNDTTGTGTEALPWLTLGKFHTSAAVAGDICYMRGGTYPFPAQLSLTKDGSAGNLISVFNYPGETPILDASTNGNTGGHAILRFEGASYWHIKGLTLIESPGYAIYAPNSSGGAHNNIIEMCEFYHNVRLDSSGGAVSFQPGVNHSNNLILNCDFHHNGLLPASTGGSGVGMGGLGTGNIIRGNRFWRNNDNGIETWEGANTLIENNLVWETGYNEDVVGIGVGEPSGGDGVGFKLGGGVVSDGNHIVRNNVAWKNLNTGFDTNSALLPTQVYNNTGWDNGQVVGVDFGYYDSVAHVLRNNLSYLGGVNIHATVDDTFNSWNLGVTVTTADFQSMSYSTPPPARQADGSLPDLPFLKLVSGSDLINAGTPISGVTYVGSAPDLGAFELAATSRFVGFSANTSRFRYVRDNSDVLYLADVATYTGQQLTSANGHIVSANVSSADFTIASASDGAVMTVGSKPIQTVHGSGLATHMYLVNTSASRLLMVTTCSSQVLASGNAVTIGSWSVTAIASANT